MWHAMTNMESLLNYNPVNPVWTYEIYQNGIFRFVKQEPCDGDYQARFCEKLRGKFPRLTRPANRYVNL
jgi:hypothetical protein